MNTEMGGERSLPFLLGLGRVLMYLLGPKMHRTGILTDATGRESLHGNHSYGPTCGSGRCKEGKEKNRLEFLAGDLGADPSAEGDPAAWLRADGDQPGGWTDSAGIDQIPD